MALAAKDRRSSHRGCIAYGEPPAPRRPNEVPCEPTGAASIASVDVEEYRRTSQQVWETMAPGWERWRAQLAEALTPVREWLIGALAPQPGDTVLELGAGTGETGFEAAALLGEDGRLVSSDFSSEMVEVARRRGDELRLGNVDYRVIDAERIELDSASVDGVLCQSTYMLAADSAAALAETRRVLRPGGRLALSVWAAPERNPWASIGGMILIERGHLPPPEPGAPGVFSMASAERTSALLAAAGFTPVRTEEVPVRFGFRDLDDYDQWVIDVAGPFAMVLRGLPEDEREVLRARLSEAFVPFATKGGYELPGLALCAVAS
jgi:ubiquinone/menaquinone biosynthesis C-methylase UbiE